MRVARVVALGACLLVGACAGDSGSSGTRPATGPGRMLVYTNALETLRLDAEGGLLVEATPAPGSLGLELRSLTVHPSKRWLAGVARVPGGIWDRVVVVPLDERGVPTVGGLRAQALGALQGEVRSGSREPRGLAAAAFAPDGASLFVAHARFLAPFFDCHGPAAITAHAFDPATGVLQPAGSAVDTLTDPLSLQPDAAGQLYALATGDPSELYGPCGQGGVSVHALSGGGALAAGASLVVDHAILGAARGANQLVFIRRYFDARTDEPATSLSAWSYSATSGFVANGAVEFPSTFGAGGPAVDGAGRFVYVVVRSRLHAYAIGSFSPLAGTPVEENGAVGPELFVSPDGRFLYARPLGTATAGVRGYRLDPASGTPQPLAGSPFLAGRDVAGGWVFAANP